MEVIKNECISKLEVVRILQKAYTEGRIQAKDGCTSVLDDINAADVQATKRGWWKAAMMSEATGWDLSLTGGRDEVCEYNCSVCGQANILDEFGNEFLPPYCPFCGAEMKNPKPIKG